MPQVNKEHYDFSNYVDIYRWGSYYSQVLETVQFKPKSVLVIGVGDNIVPSIIQCVSLKWGGIVDTFDFDKQLSPTYIGDVRNINEIIENKYDVIVCCQVLEHISFEYFDDILRRISFCLNLEGHFILSLPQSAYQHFLIDLKFVLPRIKQFRRIITFNRRGSWDMFENDQHFWEIGFKGYHLNKIFHTVSKYYRILKQYTLYENPNQRFFICEKAK